MRYPGFTLSRRNVIGSLRSIHSVAPWERRQCRHSKIRRQSADSEAELWIGLKEPPGSGAVWIGPKEPPRREREGELGIPPNSAKNL